MDNTIMIFFRALDGVGERQRTIDLLVPLSSISFKIDMETNWVYVNNHGDRGSATYRMTEAQYNKVLLGFNRPLDNNQIFINCGD